MSEKSFRKMAERLTIWASREGPPLQLDMIDLKRLSPLRSAAGKERDAREMMNALHDVALFREALGWEGLRLTPGPRGGLEKAIVEADRETLHVVASLMARRTPSVQSFIIPFPHRPSPPASRSAKRPRRFSVRCGDEVHHLHWTPDGPLAFLHHSRDEVRAAAVLKALGLYLTGCFHLLDSLRQGINVESKAMPSSWQAAEEMLRHRRRRIAEKALLRPDPPLLSVILGMADRQMAARALVMAELRALGARFAWVAGTGPAWAELEDNGKLILTVHPSLSALARHGIRSDGQRGLILLGASRWGPNTITTVAVDLVRETLLFREIPSPFPFAHPLSFHPMETWADWPEGREDGVRIAFEGVGAGWRRWLEALRSAGLQVAIRRLEASLRHQQTEGLLEVRPAPPDRLLAEGCRRGFDVVVSPCHEDENNP